MKHIFTVLLIVCTLSAIGQVVETERIEIPFEYSDENYLLALAGEQGLVLFCELKEDIKKKETWKAIVLDTVLKEKFNIRIEVSDKYAISGYEYHEGYFYLLFNENSFSKNDFLLTQVSMKSGEVVHYQITNELAIDLSYLSINSTHLAVGGYINFRPIFLVFDYIDNKVQVIPGFFNKKSTVFDFNYDKAHNSYNVLMGQKNALNVNQLTLISFHNSGKVLIDEKYEFDKNWRALNGKVIIGSNGRVFVSGSYADNNSYYSQGYYFGSLGLGENLSMKYIKFTDVDRFFDYMKPKRASRIRAKIENARKRNKSYEFKSQVFVHQLREQKEEFVVISELYRPEFKESSNTVSPSTPNYKEATRQKYVSKSSKLANTDGASHISYYETVVLRLDEKGKLLWSQSIPLNGLQTLALEQVAEVYQNDGQGVLLFKEGNDLAYSHLDVEKGIVSDSVFAINTFKEYEEVHAHTEQEGRVQHWYGNNFIVWGYQKISNKQSIQKEEKHSVFFINKLWVE